MRIRQLTALLVRLPLKRTFTHASATRSDSENILVRCELENGTTGWGEGVPRSYVTGETPDGCLAQFAATLLAEQLSGDAATWPEVLRLCEAFSPAPIGDDSRGCSGNALRCAVELSILDAYGRLFGEPLSAAAAHDPAARPLLDLRNEVRYSAVIGSGSRRLWRSALVRRLYGFPHCKVKVGRAGDDDAARLRTIRRWIGKSVDLRVDANEAWHADELLDRLRPLAECDITCVEQPLPHAEVAALAALREPLRAMGVEVMLDESLTSARDAQASIDAGTCDLWNLRLSKCGGWLACVRLAATAHSAGLGYQLGCHPGETGILSAAGRHFATTIGGIRFLEGSYDRYLFHRLLTREDMTFGYGGRGRALAGPGLGITVDEAVLRDVTRAEQSFPIG